MRLFILISFAFLNQVALASPIGRVSKLRQLTLELTTTGSAAAGLEERIPTRPPLYGPNIKVEERDVEERTVAPYYRPEDLWLVDVEEGDMKD